MIANDAASGPAVTRLANAISDLCNYVEEVERQSRNAFDEAKRAKEEMAKLNTDNQRLLSEAREERAKLLREAKLTGDKLISEARDKAKEEANKIVIDARQEIENQKNKAIVEVKNQVGQMSIDIAEKLIRQQMNSPEQKTLVDKLVNEIKLS